MLTIGQRGGHFCSVSNSGYAFHRRSPQTFDQSSPAERIIGHQQRNRERRHVVRQTAIGAGIHIANKNGGCFFEIASVEIVEGATLAALNIFVARHISYQGTFHFRQRSPNPAQRNVESFE